MDLQIHQLLYKLCFGQRNPEAPHTHINVLTVGNKFGICCNVFVIVKDHVCTNSNIPLIISAHRVYKVLQAQLGGIHLAVVV